MNNDLSFSITCICTCLAVSLSLVVWCVVMFLVLIHPFDRSERVAHHCETTKHTRTNHRHMCSRDQNRTQDHQLTNAQQEKRHATMKNQRDNKRVQTEKWAGNTIEDWTRHEKQRKANNDTSRPLLHQSEGMQGVSSKFHSVSKQHSVSVNEASVT